jgi:hypothetical protein
VKRHGRTAADEPGESEPAAAVVVAESKMPLKIVCASKSIEVLYCI